MKYSKSLFLFFIIIITLILVFIIFFKFTYPPNTLVKNQRASSHHEVDQVIGEAGRIKILLHEELIMYLDEGKSFSNGTKLFSKDGRKFVLTSGKVINWRPNPRNGILIEADRAVDGYYVFIDQDLKIGTRRDK